MTIEDIYERLKHKEGVQLAGAKAESMRNSLNKDIAISKEAISTVRNTDSQDYAIFKTLVSEVTALRNQYQFILKGAWVIETRKEVEAYYKDLNVADANGDYFKELDFALTMKDRRTPEDAQALLGIGKEEWDKQVRANPVRFRSDIRKMVEQKVNTLSDDILNAQTPTDSDKARMKKRYEGDIEDFFKKIIEDGFRDLESIFPNKTTRSQQLQRVFDMKGMFMQISSDILNIGELYATGWDTELQISRGDETLYKSVVSKRMAEQAELRKVMASKGQETAKLAELEATNAALVERNRLIDIQIKAKESTLRGLNALSKTTMFNPVGDSTAPEGAVNMQPSDTFDVAKDMASGGVDEEDEDDIDEGG